MVLAGLAFVMLVGPLVIRTLVHLVQVILKGLWLLTMVTLKEGIRLVIGAVVALLGLDFMVVKSAVQAWILQLLQLLASKCAIILIAPGF